MNIKDKNTEIMDFIRKVQSKVIANEEELRVSFVRLFEIISGKRMNHFERKTTVGRTDIIFRDTVIELKSPFILNDATKEAKAVKQAKNYMNKEVTKAFVFDGNMIININSMKKQKVNPLSLLLLCNLISDESSSISLSRENIQQQLSPINNIPFLKNLYGLAEKGFKKEGASLWKSLFALAAASDGNAYLNTLKADEIFNIFGTEADFNISLFTLHTYFSIIVKNIITNNLFDQGVLEGDKPRSAVELESGDFWIENKIYNMFKSDIFSWYLEGDEQVLAEVELFIAKKINKFRSISFDNINDDFFNVVYETVIPHAIRKSLGEYYTPPEFAMQMLEFADVDFNKRIMDPTCGSGTFLVQAVNKKLDLMVDDDDIDIEKILSSVVGIDLNPVALLAAKANVLIRLLPLRREDQPIMLPIFSNDSTTINSAEFRDLNGSVAMRDFNTETEKMVFAYEFVEFEKGGRQQIAKDILIAQNGSMFDAMSKAYDIVNKGDDNININMNIDQRVFTNIIPRVDYIVGNPPWVKWSNLPEEFRGDLKARGFKDLFSGYQNSGGNSLDLYAPIIMASSLNYLAKNGEIAMIMPMSLNFNSSMEGVRKFKFLNGQKISAIREFSSSCKVFKGVSTNFGFYVIDNKKELRYEKVDGKFEISKMHPHMNEMTNVIIPFPSKKSFEKIKPLLGKRDEKYKVRSGVQFSPNKLRQFNLENVSDKVVELKSAKLRKEQKAGIENIVIRAEKEAVKKILRTTNLRGSNEYSYSWWLYEPGTKQPMDLKEVKNKFPILFDSLKKISPLLDKKHTSKFNDRISKSPWYGNTRVGEYTQAPYRVCFSDNGAFEPVLVTDINLIPEGHVRFIPLYDKKDAERIFNILNRPEVKELMRLQYLNLNKSFLPQYMYIKF